MISKECYKFPYNGSYSDNNKLFLSEKVCLELSNLQGEIQQNFFIKSKKCIIKYLISLGVIFGKPDLSFGIGLIAVPKSIPIEQTIKKKSSVYYQDSSQFKPVELIQEKSSTINFFPNQVFIDLIYVKSNLNLDQKFLKNLRGGSNSISDVVLFALFIYAILQQQGVEGFVGDFAAIYQRYHTPIVKPNPNPNPNGPSQQSDRFSKPEPRPRTSVALRAVNDPRFTQVSGFKNSNGSYDLDKAYDEVLRRARNSDSFNCSKERFIELASEAGRVTHASGRSTITALQLEADGVVKNVRRDLIAESNGLKTIDYLVDGANGETHLEIKNPVGSEINKQLNKPHSPRKTGKKLGQKAQHQVKYWTNATRLPDSRTIPENNNKVIVVFDLFDVPDHEKAETARAVHRGINNRLNNNNVLFINQVINR